MNPEPHRILVPLDGSPEAETALEAVLPLARAFSSEVILLTVMGSPDIPPRVYPSLLRTSEILWSRGFSASFDLRIGKPEEEILAFAREKQVDLVAMATHGRSGLSRVLVGSVAEEVLRHSEMPLFVSKPRKTTRGLERILVALDGSERAEDILGDVAPIAWRLHASVDVVKVTPPIIAAAGLAEPPIVIPPEDATPYLKEIAARLAAESVDARAVPLTGRAATEILRHAVDSGAGLLCMTTHGRTGLTRLLVGSVAEEIIRHAPCPVLVRRMAAVAKAR